MSFYADDLVTARDWYTDLLGMEPYHAFPKSSAVPAYIEFRLGADQDKRGSIDRKFAPGGASNPLAAP